MFLLSLEVHNIYCIFVSTHISSTSSLSRTTQKAKHNPLKDLIYAKSISLIWKTKAALRFLSLFSLSLHSHMHAGRHTSCDPSAHSLVPCCYLGDVMCHFSLKALSQNGLFHQSSRRWSLCLWQGFSIQDKEQSCPSLAA